MTNAWDRAASLAEKHSNQGGLFIRLTNNHDKVIGVFCGAPYSREVVWTGDCYENYDVDVHTDKKASLRVMLNFYVPAEGDMKVIEGGTAWLKDLMKVRDKYGLDKWLFEIERHGEPRDPKTKYTILPEEKIDADLRARIDDAGLRNLAVLVGDETEDPGKQEVVSQEMPEHIASELVSRLKQLPRSEVDLFLREFKVTRVRDLAPSALDDARSFLGQMEAHQQRQVEPAAIDPFA